MRKLLAISMLAICCAGCSDSKFFDVVLGDKIESGSKESNENSQNDNSRTSDEASRGDNEN